MKSRLLEQLAAGAGVDRLVCVQMTAGRRPRAFAVTAAPLSKQHASVTNNEHPDTDARFEWLAGYRRVSARD